jgi:hypothetical protein
MKALAVYETAFGARRQRSTTRSTEPPIHVAAGRRSTEPPFDSVIASIGIASSTADGEHPRDARSRRTGYL